MILYMPVTICELMELVEGAGILCLVLPPWGGRGGTLIYIYTIVEE